MKITTAQLRKIIKEEVRKTLRLIEMAEEADAYIEIPNVSVHAEGAGMSIDEFVDMALRLGNKFQLVFGDPEGYSNDAYSATYDSFVAHGKKSNLEAFAHELDEDLMGGAQSFDDEDSFVNYVQVI